MPEFVFADEWLLQSLEGLVTPEQVTALREHADPSRSLWETLVAEKIATDERILEKLAARTRLKIADVSQIEADIREGVDESLARRYRVLPLRLTDSFLELATANPLDLDAEKALAFATGREIRMQLLSPGQIHAKLDEIYKPEKAIDKLLEGMGDSEELKLLEDQL